jgi:hypothetical protein
MAKPSEVLVWINADGSARELTDAEKKYVDAEFSPFDGARPFIKSHYEQRNGWGKTQRLLATDSTTEGYAHQSHAPDERAAEDTAGSGGVDSRINPET